MEAYFFSMCAAGVFFAQPYYRKQVDPEEQNYFRRMRQGEMTFGLYFFIYMVLAVVPGLIPELVSASRADAVFSGQP
ncbi:MAG: hypothetical protein AAF830_15935 [Pseudomonadota bacterium]